MTPVTVPARVRLSELPRGSLYELLVRLAKAYGGGPAVDFARVRAILADYEG